ncbi:MAG: hypothetical protein HYY51_00390 [Candidatus Magasanikbacteria bacterium]|nr:hypothetical protein [Candidatus Magasanikbacteria bacterium]
MKYLKSFTEISKKDVRLAGGKGASLGELTKAGLSVPPGFVLISSAFDRFIDETDLAGEIEARLKEVNPEDINSVDKAANVIRDLIHDAALPKDLSEEILQAYQELGAAYVAVRSSATAEDSEIASWAGELDTFLNTNQTDLLDRVKQCWSSLFTPRAIFYRFEKKLHDTPVSVAVVIQRMIQSEVSGVAFTVHPVIEDKNQMIIEAGLGLGEALVSGQITPDSYVVDKADMMILDISVSHQEKQLLRKDKMGEHEESKESNEWVETFEAGKKQKLQGKDIIELAGICKKIEEYYGFPCDIEWAREGNSFYITQSRPITTLKA